MSYEELERLNSKGRILKGKILGGFLESINFSAGDPAGFPTLMRWHWSELLDELFKKWEEVRLEGILKKVDYDCPLSFILITNPNGGKIEYGQFQSDGSFFCLDSENKKGEVYGFWNNYSQINKIKGKIRTKEEKILEYCKCNTLKNQEKEKTRLLKPLRRLLKRTENQLAKRLEDYWGKRIIMRFDIIQQQEQKYMRILGEGRLPFVKPYHLEMNPYKDIKIVG